MQETARPVKIGDEIPSLTKTAFMTIEQDARNPIHTDDYAKRFGMRGALVGGSTLLSYILEMLYSYFGLNWFTYGKIKVSFIGGGAINGDIVTARGLINKIEPEEAGDRLILDIWMERESQDKIVVGEATCIQ